MKDEFKLPPCAYASEAFLNPHVVSFVMWALFVSEDFPSSFSFFMFDALESCCVCASLSPRCVWTEQNLRQIYAFSLIAIWRTFALLFLSSLAHPCRAPPRSLGTINFRSGSTQEIYLRLEMLKWANLFSCCVTTHSDKARGESRRRKTHRVSSVFLFRCCCLLLLDSTTCFHQIWETFKTFFLVKMCVHFSSLLFYSTQHHSEKDPSYKLKCQSINLVIANIVFQTSWIYRKVYESLV